MLFSVVYVVALMGALGPVYGYPASGDQRPGSSGGPIPQCPYDAIEGTIITRLAILNSRLSTCVTPSDSVKEMIRDPNNTKEEYRELFKNLCTKELTVHQCLDNVTALSGVCLNAEDQMMLAANIDFVESGIGVVCLGEGERIATIFAEEAKYLRAQNITRLQFCLNDWFVDAFISMPYDNFATFTLKRYSAFNMLKQCFVDIAHGQYSKINTSVTVINEYMRKMTCISQKPSAIVPCEEIGDVTNSI